MEEKQSNNEVIYKIVSFKENYNGTSKIAVQLQVINSSRSFFCLVEDVYNKNWLTSLSKEDCGLCFFTPSFPIFSKFRRNDSFEASLMKSFY